MFRRIIAFLKKLISESNIDPKEIYETIPKLEVVDVNLQIEDDLSAIQTVFEKINSTGKRLTPADLIRNYLLLANTSAEQERLYEDYWVKIEQKIKNDNISRFARDYLILNVFEDVPEDKEFADSLMNSVNTNYARAVLLKIEDGERSNVLVSLSGVTVEHIMQKKHIQSI